MQSVKNPSCFLLGCLHWFLSSYFTYIRTCHKFQMIFNDPNDLFVDLLDTLLLIGSSNLRSSRYSTWYHGLDGEEDYTDSLACMNIHRHQLKCRELCLEGKVRVSLLLGVEVWPGKWQHYRTSRD